MLPSLMEGQLLLQGEQVSPSHEGLISENTRAHIPHPHTPHLFILLTGYFYHLKASAHYSHLPTSDLRPLRKGDFNVHTEVTWTRNEEVWLLGPSFVISSIFPL